MKIYRIYRHLVWRVFGTGFVKNIIRKDILITLILLNGWSVKLLMMLFKFGESQFMDKRRNI